MELSARPSVLPPKATLSQGLRAALPSVQVESQNLVREPSAALVQWGPLLLLLPLPVPAELPSEPRLRGTRKTRGPK